MLKTCSERLLTFINNYDGRQKYVTYVCRKATFQACI